MLTIAGGILLAVAVLWLIATAMTANTSHAAVRRTAMEDKAFWDAHDRWVAKQLAYQERLEVQYGQKPKPKHEYWA